MNKLFSFFVVRHHKDTTEKAPLVVLFWSFFGAGREWGLIGNIAKKTPRSGVERGGLGIE